MSGDDYAAMLASLQERMLPEDIADALEVDEHVLDEILEVESCHSYGFRSERCENEVRAC